MAQSKEWREGYRQGVEDFGKHVRTVEDIGDELGLGHMAVRNLAKRRGLGTRVGRFILFTPSDVEALTTKRVDLRTRKGRAMRAVEV